MDGWEIAIIGGILKNMQEEMIEEVTRIQDIFLKLKSEMHSLSEKWKGIAADEFQLTFFSGWNEIWQEIQSIAMAIAGLVQIEADMEGTEQKVQNLLIRGGVFGR